jgi:lysozyme|tara:strand:+ start:311 stop:721 length:411 start_codon:yes stop_codon:yes gene_type:complete
MNKAKLREEIIRDEGLRLEMYSDTRGKLTIGVGRNIEDNGISKEEARIMLENDLMTTESELDYRIPWWRDLPDDAQRALANMMFNMGWPTLSKFDLMIGYLKDRDFQNAAEEALDSRWASQVGNRAYRITELMRNA